jgi:hypothetical protein
MLYLAISSCARVDSASASSGNSVDSALASSARILPSIRSSTSLVTVRRAAGRASPGSGSSWVSGGSVASAEISSTAVRTASRRVCPSRWRQRSM